MVGTVSLVECSNVHCPFTSNIWKPNDKKKEKPVSEEKQNVRLMKLCKVKILGICLEAASFPCIYLCENLFLFLPKMLKRNPMNSIM